MYMYLHYYLINCYFLLIPQVLFLPLTNSILTCFRDDSIHVWEADTLEYKYNLPVPAGPLPRYRAFAVTQNG